MTNPQECLDPVLSAAKTRLPAGIGLTLIVEAPLFASLVAVMVALPGAKAVTNPLGETVATVASLVVQVMLRPVRTLPATSKVVAVNPSVLVTAIVALDGVTVTVA